MELTKEAIEAIQRYAIEAAELKKAVTIVDTPDPRKKFVVHGAKHEEFVIPPPFRNHQVASLQDLINYTGELIHAAVWHSPAAVIMLLNDDDRRERVTFFLELSDAWKQLRSLDERPTALPQKDLIRLLRLHLGASADVVTTFRKLDFQTQIKNVGDLQKTRESLGRSIEAEVQGIADLPDELTVFVPIYCNVAERDPVAVRLLLEYDPQALKILVIPEPGMLNELEEAHQADIHARLEAGLNGDGEDAIRDWSIPIYCGTP